MRDAMNCAVILMTYGMRQCRREHEFVNKLQNMRNNISILENVCKQDNSLKKSVFHSTFGLIFKLLGNQMYIFFTWNSQNHA